VNAKEARASSDSFHSDTRFKMGEILDTIRNMSLTGHYKTYFSLESNADVISSSLEELGYSVTKTDISDGSIIILVNW
jgi:hypothetical protein